jgi:hypothetical protein
MVNVYGYYLFQSRNLHYFTKNMQKCRFFSWLSMAGSLPTASATDPGPLFYIKRCSLIIARTEYRYNGPALQANR